MASRAALLRRIEALEQKLIPAEPIHIYTQLPEQSQSDAVTDYVNSLNLSLDEATELRERLLNDDGEGQISSIVMHVLPPKRPLKITRSQYDPE